MSTALVSRSSPYGNIPTSSFRVPYGPLMETRLLVQSAASKVVTIAVWLLLTLTAADKGHSLKPDGLMSRALRGWLTVVAFLGLPRGQKEDPFHYEEIS